MSNLSKITIIVFTMGSMILDTIAYESKLYALFFIGGVFETTLAFYLFNWWKEHNLDKTNTNDLRLEDIEKQKQIHSNIHKNVVLFTKDGSNIFVLCYDCNLGHDKL